MFGGYGIYAGDKMFGLIAEGTLYLKVDERNEARFVAAGLERFVYHSPKGPMSMGYRRAPPEGLDDGEVLQDWARGAIAASVAAVKKPTAAETVAKKPSAAKPKARKAAPAKVPRRRA
jgi:DNA transformation protein